MKFKAAILTEINMPLTVAEIETTPLAIGQVLVKILTSGLCGAQLLEIAGHKGNTKFVPHLIGHEGCGIVEEIGLGVTRVKKGDKVVLHWRIGAGIESPFPQYIFNGRVISSGKVTTISQYSVVSENRMTVVPEHTSPELCALLGCGLTTALGTINNEAKVRIGESVLILGGGGVGLNLVQGCKLVGAYPIRVLERNIGKTKLINECGGICFQNFELLSQLKFDVIFDTTGNTNLISEAARLLSNSGRFILIGQPVPGLPLTILNANGLFNGIGQTIKATQGGNTSPNDDILRYINVNNGGRANFTQIITHTFKLDGINDAITLLRSGDAGRIMINTQ